jgi:hypothetical protein
MKGDLMSKWKIAWSAAIIAAAMTPALQADDFTKLTLLTFSGPVDVPGITLPAGTYRFELADPTTGRRVIKVSDKDGSKTYGMFISVPNERMKPADKPVVMFREAAAGAPPAVQAWFYPGETYGYEFAYPHDQALKIAKATHQPVLSYTDRSDASASDSDRIAAMKSGDVARIDENDKPVSADEALKESSERRTPTAAGASTSPPTATEASAARPNSGSSPQSATAVGTSGTTASRGTAPTTGGASANAAAQTPAPSTAAARPARQHLPRTGSSLPLLGLLAGLLIASGCGVRLARKTL